MLAYAIIFEHSACFFISCSFADSALAFCMFSDLIVLTVSFSSRSIVGCSLLISSLVA